MKYRVWFIESQEEQARQYDKGAPRAAAESFADDVDLYGHEEDRPRSVYVRGPDGKVTVWSVSGERVVHYCAKMVHEVTP